jgi:hypothetical protein
MKVAETPEHTKGRASRCAVGCYLCGCMTGEVGPEVDEEEVAPS